MCLQCSIGYHTMYIRVSNVIQNFYEGDMCKYRKYWACMWEDENVRRPFWGPINHQSELQTAKNQKNQNSWATIWPLTPENWAIGSVRRERSSDQTHFLPIKKLDRGHKRFNRRRISDYPLEWLTWSAENYDRRLARCGWLTILRGWAGEPCKIWVSPAKCGWVGRSGTPPYV